MIGRSLSAFFRTGEHLARDDIKQSAPVIVHLIGPGIPKRLREGEEDRITYDRIVLRSYANPRVVSAELSQ